MVTTMMKTTTTMKTTDGRKTEMQHAAASAFAPPVIAAPPGQYDAGVEEGVEGDPSGPSRCTVESPRDTRRQTEAETTTEATTRAETTTAVQGDEGSAGDGESGVVRRQAAAATAEDAAGPTVASHLGMLSYFILS